MTKNPIIKKLLLELSVYKKELIIVMLSIAAVSSAMLSLGHTIKLFIDQGIKTNNVHALNQTIIYLGIAVVVLAVGSFFRSFYINSISDKVVSNIRLKTYQSLLNHQIKYFDEMKVSDIISRFSHDLSLISDIITNLISFSIRNFFLIAGGMVMMFVQNAKLSMIVMTSVPICLVMISRLGKKVRLMARELHSKKAALEEVIGETMSNIRVVYAFNIQDYRVHKLTDIAVESSGIARRYLRIRAMFFALAITVVTSLLLIVLWIGGLDVIDGTISSGNMVSFIFYAVSTAFAIGGIAEVVGDLQKSFAGAERVFELQDLGAVVDVSSSGPKSVILVDDVVGARGSQDVGFVFAKKLRRDSRMTDPITSLYIHVSKFFYPSRPELQILHDVTINAKAGEFIGLAGPSGSGKSTILQIIMGLYKAEKSSVKLNGHEVDLSLSPDLVKRVAYVPQDPFLFSASIEENITLGREGGDLDEVLKITGLDEVIASFPKGLKTYVGEKGMQLSGGQKQRISLARSIYGRPDVILLDEATSALDLHAENHVIEHLRKFMKGKIIISVAHRLSSIKNADKIFLIHSGVLVAAGDHKKLLEISPLYKHLATFQNV